MQKTVVSSFVVGCLFRVPFLQGPANGNAVGGLERGRGTPSLASPSSLPWGIKVRKPRLPSLLGLSCVTKTTSFGVSG